VTDISHSTGSTGNPVVQNGQIERLHFSPLEYKGKRVLTTERLATAFETNEMYVTTNFSRNKERFIEGVHYFRVTGGDLKALKNDISFSNVVGKNASHFVLWTERGVARHAKILDTDTAWEIFEQLEDTYFAVRNGEINLDALPIAPRLKVVGDAFASLKRIATTAGFKGNQAVLSAAMATNKAIGVNPLELIGATHLLAAEQEQFVTPTQISVRLDPKTTAQLVNKALEALGLQIEHRRTKKGKDRHDYWELTPAGKKAGGEYLDTGKKHADGTPVKQIKWPASVIGLVQQHMSGAAKTA
jgi:hypothetical protein